MGLPGWLRIAFWTSVHLRTGCLSMAVRRSPGCKPAFEAGDGLPATSDDTAEIFNVAWVGSWMPTPAKITNRTRNAVTKCVAEPAHNTIARFHRGAAANERGSSS